MGKKFTNKYDINTEMTCLYMSKYFTDDVIAHNPNLHIHISLSMSFFSNYTMSLADRNYMQGIMKNIFLWYSETLFKFRTMIKIR